MSRLKLFQLGLRIFQLTSPIFFCVYLQSANNYPSLPKYFIGNIPRAF